MFHHVLRLVPAVLATGCSFIYDPSKIDRPSADAQVSDSDTTVDMIMIDADPSMLMIEKVAPVTLLEGQGVDGSRPALLVIRGRHMIPEATVAVTGATGITVGAVTVSSNGMFLAAPVTIAVDGAMDDQLVDLTVQVTQPGAPMQELTGQLKLQYLPELDSGTTIAVSSLADLYSRVNLGNVTFTGSETEQAILTAVSSITVGDISVAGGDGGTGSSVGAGGPGGCPGGPGGTNGGCNGMNQAGAGLGGTDMFGGGGGGFGEAGSMATGGAAGGLAHGSPQLVRYVIPGNVADTNRSGGGGGGQSTLLASKGAGGGGGGVLELTAGGNITTGVLNANGGTGGSPTGLTGGGGGGGGSGGAIVIRTAAGTLTTGMITALGGGGGAGVSGGGAGGGGGVGRIRIDSPADPPVSTPEAHRGPSFVLATPPVVTTATPPMTLVGNDGDRVDGFVIDMDGTLVTSTQPVDQTLSNGSVLVTPALSPGYNRLCFSLEPGARPTSATVRPLIDTCIEIAYLP